MRKTIDTIQQEQAIIKKYRELNEAGKEYIDEQLDFALDRGKYKR